MRIEGQSQTGSCAEREGVVLRKVRLAVVTALLQSEVGGKLGNIGKYTDIDTRSIADIDSEVIEAVVNNIEASVDAHLQDGGERAGSTVDGDWQELELAAVAVKVSVDCHSKSITSQIARTHSVIFVTFWLNSGI